MNYATDTLRRRALVTNLCVRKYSATKTDKRASDKVENDNGAQAKTAQVRKRIIVHDLLRDFTRNEQSARHYMYRMTFPWSDTGMRLLPIDAYEDYISQMGVYQEEAFRLVDAIVESFPQMKEEAKKYLGSLYDEMDYPSAASVQKYFDFDVVVQPMPAFDDDIRINLGDHQAEMIRKETEQRMKSALTESMNEAWKRLYDVVCHVKERVEPESRVHKTSIQNAREIAELLPKLNINQDQELDRLAAELKASLPHDVRQFRKSDEDKKKLHDDMDRILGQMSEPQTYRRTTN